VCVQLFKGPGTKKRVGGLVVYVTETSDVQRWFVQVWRGLVRHSSRAGTSCHVICQVLQFACICDRVFSGFLDLVAVLLHLSVDERHAQPQLPLPSVYEGSRCL